MPELPEVECLARSLRELLVGQTIGRFRFFRTKIRWPIPTAQLAENIADHLITSVERRSKYLLISTARDTLIIHLGMSGNLFYSSSQDSPEPHCHARFAVQASNQVLGYLHYVDPRRFGAILYSPVDLLADHPLLKHLGPEPLSSIDLGKHLYLKSRGRKLAVKVFLMNSENVVGVGNIYACEALFEAQVHPSVAAGKVTRNQWTRLAAAIQKVLSKAILAGGTSFRDYRHVDGSKGGYISHLKVYQKKNTPCPSCGLLIKEIKQGARATFFCSRCQKRS
jgi:formamidopyrimidine-DNA glycosylase